MLPPQVSRTMQSIRGIISPECRDCEGLTPLEAFDTLRVNFLSEDPETFAKSRFELQALLESSGFTEIQESDASSIDRWFGAVSSLEGSLVSLPLELEDANLVPR